MSIFLRNNGKGWEHQVYIDQVQVGAGSEESCRALAVELRNNHILAESLKKELRYVWWLKSKQGKSYKQQMEAREL